MRLEYRGKTYMADTYCPNFAPKPYNLFHIGYKCYFNNRQIYIISPLTLFRIKSKEIEELYVVEIS